MKSPAPVTDDLLPGFCTGVFAIIVALFAVRNLPWHLDDYDQAKQAFTSFEIMHGGSWLFQHTPDAESATKPPLAAWISTLLYLLAGGHGWDLAWRLPSFVCALLLLRTLARTGENLFGNNIGALLAAGAFGLNTFTPRLATLVRTDMLLATLIFYTGWMVLEKLREDEPWTRREQWITCALILAATLTKGPIIYGFLVPGMLAHYVIAKRHGLETRVCAAWWAWLAPLAIFALWAGYGIANNSDFYEQVVQKEFLGRFTIGKTAVHHNFLPGWFSLNLLARALPWSLLLVIFGSVKKVRAALCEDPELLWLACWTLGGLVFMEFVPSKRFDRIFPVVPPACLLLAAAARYLPDSEWKRQPIGRLAIFAAVLGGPVAVGYASWRIVVNWQVNGRVLAKFGETVRAVVADQHDRLAVIAADDEGLLLYSDHPQFHSFDDAQQMWRFGRIDWVVVGEENFAKVKRKFGPCEELASTPKLPARADAPAPASSYHFLKRLPKPDKNEARSQPAK